MKTYKITFFLSFIYFLANAQIYDSNREQSYKQVFVETDNFNTSYLDSLELYYSREKDPQIQFKILNDLAYYWHTRNLDSAHNYTKRGLQLTASKPDSLWYGKFLSTMGSILLRQEKLDSAQHVLRQAESLVNRKDLAFIKMQLGYVFERRGELDKAADFAMECMDLGKELDDPKALAMAYSDLSNLFWKQSKFEKGIEFGLKSLDLFESINMNDLDYDFTLYVVANNYLSLKQYDEALRLFNHSIAIGERYGFYNNLSDVYISLTDLYSEITKPELARNAATLALKYAELLGNDFMEMRSYMSIGKLNNDLGNYSEAILNLEKSIEVATENFGDEYFLSDAYNELAEAYQKNGDYKMAYSALKQYDRLKDEVFTSEADQRISLLQTEFDVAQKEDTIALQEAEIEKQKLRQILITIVVGLLCISIFGLIFFLGKNRKKNNLLRKQNEEKEFLLKEIHHRVKNNLEIVSGLLALQSEQIKDKHVSTAMIESQNRVQSMGMIHQKLYQGTNLSSIEMSEYFNNLGQHILDVFGAEDRVKIDCDMDKVELDVDTAVPLGLIVNELLTNALKYAFPKNSNGIIKVSLIKDKNKVLKLVVSDNGVGASDEVTQGTGFGSQLIQLLNQQLNGEMSLKNNSGTEVSFVFKSFKAA